jgi:hypothetical protein
MQIVGALLKEEEEAGNEASQCAFKACGIKKGFD